MKFNILLFNTIMLLSFSLNSQNSEFRDYEAQKNKFTSTTKSNNAFNKGRDFYNSGDFRNAIFHFTTTIEEDKKQNYFSTDALINRASAYTQLGEYSNAIIDYTSVIDNEKDKTYLIIAYTARGGIYGFQEKFDLAIMDFNFALKLNPNDVDTLYNLARLKIQKRDYLSGLELLNQAQNEYEKQKIKEPLILSSILYMKGVSKYSLNRGDYCDDFNLSLNFKESLVKEQINLIEKMCNK